MTCGSRDSTTARGRRESDEQDQSSTKDNPKPRSTKPTLRFLVSLCSLTTSTSMVMNPRSQSHKNRFKEKTQAPGPRHVRFKQHVPWVQRLQQRVTIAYYTWLRLIGTLRPISVGELSREARISRRCKRFFQQRTAEGHCPDTRRRSRPRTLFTQAANRSCAASGSGYSEDCNIL